LDKRYQVFVSSTYTDLVSERQAVIGALMQLDAIPSGMELFPAANDDAWTLIKKVIDDCDYYLLMIGGRYGSFDSEGIGFTEKEYDYAVSMGKPVMAFLHGQPDDIPSGKSEKTEAAQGKLKLFREKVQGSKHCKYWTTADELAGQVALSFAYFTKTYPAIGWVRADQQDSPETLKELNMLRKRTFELEDELQKAQRKPPVGTEGLASGDDEIRLLTSVRCQITKLVGVNPWQTPTVFATMTWDDLLGAIGAKLFDECAEQALHEYLSNFIKTYFVSGIQKDIRDWLKKSGHPPTKQTRIKVHNVTVDDDSFGTVIVQLMALGHITKSTRQRSVKDKHTYWTLTPYGESQVIRLRAIRSD
jgi:Domain of unknown function (DUF4062)